jgi:putative serine protease PepD
MHRLVQLIADYEPGGNLTTTLSRAPAEPGERVRVDIGDALRDRLADTRQEPAAAARAGRPGRQRGAGGGMKIAAGLLAASALLAGCGGQNQPPPAAPATTAPTREAPAAQRDQVTALEKRFEEVVARVSPSVVQIESGSGLGSGIVYDDRGDVVTNRHVVGSSREFTVTLASGRQLKASLVGSFPPEDLAVIHLAGDAPPRASFGDSAKLTVGQIAFAIGNPLGLRSSVTQGIVSSLGRTVPEGNGAVISSAIQTSAPINPGNSGGALVDLDAQVIGIPTLAALDPELGGSAAPGIGFAIPSNTVKRIAKQLIETGRVERSGRANLGVKAATMGGEGVLVTGVVGGGRAAHAGIRPGELITAVDGRPTPSADALAATIATLRPGQRVRVDLEGPGGATRTVTVALG